VKIVVLGGSSPSTPALFRCLAVQPRLPRLGFSLVGRSPEKLKAVLRAARLLADGLPIAIEGAGFSALEFSAALRGADVILVQVRFGGYEGRHFDESFPLDFGLCGDEGLGPGGLSAGWRSWPGMKEILATIAVTCPAALVLILSSPVGLMVGAARLHFPALRTYGICELPWTTLLDLAALLKAEASRIDYDYFGVNHIGWFHRLAIDDRDLILEYITQGFSGVRWPSSALVAACSGFPTRYLKINYNPEQVLGEQLRRVSSRAEMLRQIGRESYEVFRKGGIEQILAAICRRPTPWYEHALVPLLLSLAGVPTSTSFFLTGPNGPMEPALDSSDCLELPTAIDAGRLSARIPLRPPPAQILGTVNAFVAYERKAVQAITRQDARQMTDALTIHPWVRNAALASALVSKITSQYNAGLN
jgi:6-phospho-beta-glucosidase